MSHKWHKVLGSQIEVGTWVSVQLPGDQEVDGILELVSKDGVVLQTGDPEIIVTGRTWIATGAIESVEMQGKDLDAYDSNALVRVGEWDSPTTSVEEILNSLRLTREICSLRFDGLRYARIIAVSDGLFAYDWVNYSCLVTRAQWVPIESVIQVSWGHLAHEQMTRALASK